MDAKVLELVDEIVPVQAHPLPQHGTESVSNRLQRKAAGQAVLRTQATLARCQGTYKCDKSVCVPGVGLVPSEP